MNGPNELRSKRLLLRQWRDDDLDAFAALCVDPAAMQYLLPMPHRSDADAMAQRIQAHFSQHGFGLWAVELPGICAFMGFVGLVNVPFTAHFTPAVEFAWRLAPAFWGRGYATEAAAQALDDGFTRLAWNEVVAYTVADNKRSWRVMQRLGMTRNADEDFDHPRVPLGHPLCRHVLYRLQRKDWLDERQQPGRTSPS
jgi:RimJ/RimL family protein N-acetyltransferase